jgi:hypothetical protein
MLSFPLFLFSLVGGLVMFLIEAFVDFFGYLNDGTFAWYKFFRRYL